MHTYTIQLRNATQISNNSRMTIEMHVLFKLFINEMIQIFGLLIAESEHIVNFTALCNSIRYGMVCR